MAAAHPPGGHIWFQAYTKRRPGGQWQARPDRQLMRGLAESDDGRWGQGPESDVCYH